MGKKEDLLEAAESRELSTEADKDMARGSFWVGVSGGMMMGAGGVAVFEGLTLRDQVIGIIGAVALAAGGIIVRDSSEDTGDEMDWSVEDSAKATEFRLEAEQLLKDQPQT